MKILSKIEIDKDILGEIISQRPVKASTATRYPTFINEVILALRSAGLSYSEIILYLKKKYDISMSKDGIYRQIKKAKISSSKNDTEKGDSKKNKEYPSLSKRARKTPVFEKKDENIGGTQKQQKRVPRDTDEKRQKRVEEIETETERQKRFKRINYLERREAKNLNSIEETRELWNLIRLKANIDR